MRRDATLRGSPGSRHSSRAVGAAMLATMALTACSSGGSPAGPATTSASTAGAPTFAAAGTCDGSAALQALWRQRMSEPAGQFQPLGPGDVLRVSVAGIPELQGEVTQVSDSGTITLPYAGTIQVQGMSLSEAEQALDQRFAEYIRTPEVHIVMQDDRSQTVAVMGLVSKPMLVPLTMPDETMMDAIGEAGGLTNDASQRVLFIPSGAQARSTDPVVVPASTDPPAVSTASAGTLAPIVVDLHSGADQGCLDLPMHAGDTIVVPPAGNVMVGGWVEHPGEVQITPGMTVFGAITAAGGALYSSNAEILRASANGQRTAIPVDLSAVKSGREADPPVEAGDVVMVEGSALGALPYAFHEIFTGLGTGVAIPVP
jgi:polysaccharide biosynthesis/export protein